MQASTDFLKIPLLYPVELWTKIFGGIVINFSSITDTSSWKNWFIQLDKNMCMFLGEQYSKNKYLLHHQEMWLFEGDRFKCDSTGMVCHRPIQLMDGAT